MNIHPVTYKLNEIDIAANIYTVRAVIWTEVVQGYPMDRAAFVAWSADSYVTLIDLRTLEIANKDVGGNPDELMCVV